MANSDDAAEKRKAAFAALKFIYPDLSFTEAQITPQAAAFSFKVLTKVDFGARASSGIFSLYAVYTKWSQIPTGFAKAIHTALKDPGSMKKNRVAVALIASQHRRNLQRHLGAPDVFPCPDFRN